MTVNPVFMYLACGVGSLLIYLWCRIWFLATWGRHDEAREPIGEFMVGFFLLIIFLLGAVTLA